MLASKSSPCFNGSTMNDLLELTETKTKRMPFPSHVTTPCENEVVRSLSREIVDSARDNNNILASGEVHFFVRSHYVDTANGIYGIERLIEEILRSNGSVFPTDCDKTELRTIAIAGSMFTSEIISAVRETFGADRYPDKTILHYLSTEAKDKFGKIKLTGAEDSERECNRPRCKWYVKE
jgi:hypothetical protein